MNEISNLAARLKGQREEERAFFRDLIRVHHDAMRSELTGILKRELDTITADMAGQSRRIGWRMFRSRILWPTLIGLGLCLGLFAGNTLLTNYHADRIIELQANARILEKEGGKIQFRRCQGRLCVEIDPYAPEFGENGEYRILKGY